MWDIYGSGMNQNSKAVILTIKIMSWKNVSIVNRLFENETYKNSCRFKSLTPAEFNVFLDKIFLLWDFKMVIKCQEYQVNLKFGSLKEAILLFREQINCFEKKHSVQLK